MPPCVYRGVPYCVLHVRTRGVPSERELCAKRESLSLRREGELCAKRPPFFGEISDHEAQSAPPFPFPFHCWAVLTSPSLFPVSLLGRSPPSLLPVSLLGSSPPFPLPVSLLGSSPASPLHIPAFLVHTPFLCRVSWSFDACFP